MIYDVTKNTDGTPGITGSSGTTAIKNKLTSIVSHMAGKGGVIYFPADQYVVNGNILSLTGLTGNLSISFRGDGVEQTEFRLSGNVSASTPIFDIHGSSHASPARWIEFRGMGFEGTGSRYTATWIHLEAIAGIRLERLEFAFTKGVAIKCTACKDACFHDVHIGNVGDNASGSEASQIVLFPDSTNTYFCENFALEACRLESDYYAGLEMNLAKYVSLLGCKTHGLLPNEANLLAHLVLRGCRGVSVATHRSTNSLNTHISAASLTVSGAAVPTTGLMVLNSVLDAAKNNYGILLNSAEHCTVVANLFAKPPGIDTNDPDDVSVSGGTDILLKYNCGDATANN